MNQTILPLIPHGATPINAQVGVFNEGGHWVYLLGMHPIYRHRAGDQRGFRLTIAQLVDSQACRASEVCGALGIAKSRMDRALRLYRAGGIDAFFGRKPAKRAGRVLTAERLVSAQELLDEGFGNAEVAARLGVPANTVHLANHNSGIAFSGGGFGALLSDREFGPPFLLDTSLGASSATAAGFGIADVLAHLREYGGSGLRGKMTGPGLPAWI